MQATVVYLHNPRGLHVRVAARIVEQCKRLKSRVVLCNDQRYAEGNSILQLLLLEAAADSRLRIVAVGEDEEQAIRKLPPLLTDGAGI